MQTANLDDLTKCLIEPDEKYGTFEPDPSDPFVQRYDPAETELGRLNATFKEQIDTAWNDDEIQKQRKLRLLDAYRGTPEGKEQVVTMPLVKRAVRRNVSYAKGKILPSATPWVTVKPTSNTEVTVLVEDPQYGTVPLKKSSEEVAQALEWWMDWKLKNRLNFPEVVEIAATEAKRGQTPTWLKISHKKEKRTIKVPRFEKKGPIAVTFSSKDDMEVVSGDPDKISNVSTYSMLMPADEQDPQESRWLAESIRKTSEAFRVALYNGDYFLIDKKEYEELIESGADAEPSADEQKKAAAEKRVPSAPKRTHDIWEVWFYWTVPMKSTSTNIDDKGNTTNKTLTVNKEYSMVGHFHRRLGRFLSIVRNPFDHGFRPYVPVYDRKEPFRHTGESIAEDVINYQRAASQLLSLEIRGGVIATTPIFYAEPGSIAGDWITEHDVEPGDVVPRMRPDEIEKEMLGDRPLSLLGLIQFLSGEYEKNTSISGLQLGLTVPGRTPASTFAQAINEGQTDADDFVERFCRALIEALVLYVQTVQQYMRTGEVIPLDPETKALVEAALQGQPEQPGDGVPVRFPMAPITDQFMFSMSAISGETDQHDFEKWVAFKQIIDADGMQLAQIIGPLASGQLPPALVQALTQQIERSQKAMERIGKALARDGESYAISPNLINAIVQERQMLDQMAQQGAPNGAQGTSPNGQPPAVQPNGGGLGGAVPEPGLPQGGHVDQAPSLGPPVGASV